MIKTSRPQLLATLVIPCLLLGCQLVNDPSIPLAETERWTGVWRLFDVPYRNADSIDQRQILTLRGDSTYTCTFSLLTLDTRDTAHLLSPTLGRWQTHRYQGEAGWDWHTGIDFYQDSAGAQSGARGWSYIEGGRSQGKMFFTVDATSQPLNFGWTLEE